MVPYIIKFIYQDSMAINKNTFRALAYNISRFLPITRHIADLETASTESLFYYGEIALLHSFKTVAKTLPFYKKILEQRGVDSTSIKTLADFYTRVPVIQKEDVFPLFKADEICQHGVVNDMHSAIVTSGTSGVFAYGILTNNDILFQKKMIDEMMDYYYNAKNESLLIINALPMGVSFSSSYPVISTSVRSDIVIHLLKTFSSYYKRIVIITDPHFAKKIVDDGVDQNLNWPSLSTSFILGGTNSSSSLQMYLLTALNGKDNLNTPKNTIQGTMGLTEIGLNIFSASSELIQLRSIIENNEKLRKALFGDTVLVCPDLFYYYPTSTHVEIHDTNTEGFGSIVLSNLDTVSKTPLIRYNTGDIGKKLDRTIFLQLLQEEGITIPLTLQLPLIAISGRNSDQLINQINPAVIKEILYRDHALASKITGHFKIITTSSEVIIKIQTKRNISSLPDMATRLSDILKSIVTQNFILECLPYDEFGYDLELNYEVKWKHTI